MLSSDIPLFLSSSQIVCAQSNAVLSGLLFKIDSYNCFKDLDFYNKKILCVQLQDIKNSVVYCEDKLFFGMNGDDVQYTFILKNGKKIRTYDPDFVELEEIDRQYYFDVYFKPFLDSIFIEEFYG